MSVSEVSAEPARTAHDRGLAEVVRSVRIDRRVPFGILMVLAVTWTVAMGRLIVLRHDRFGTFDFDEGIYDQFLWQLAHGRQFDTVRGVTLAGHHASIAFLLLAPLVWLGAGPNTWNVLFAAAMAGTTIPLYFLAKDKLHNSWLALLVGVVWLAQPPCSGWCRRASTPTAWRSRSSSAPGSSASASSPNKGWSFTGHPLGLRACFLLTITWKEDSPRSRHGAGVADPPRVASRRKVVAVGRLWFLIFGVILVPRFAGGQRLRRHLRSRHDAGRSRRHLRRAPQPAGPPARPERRGRLHPPGASRGYVPLAVARHPAHRRAAVLHQHHLLVELHLGPALPLPVVPMVALAISFVEALRRCCAGDDGSVRGWPTALVAALLCTRWYGPSPIESSTAWALALDGGAILRVRRGSRDLIPRMPGCRPTT